jgi:hypothetical protein
MDKLPMCHLDYKISVGKMQRFSGNNDCILPTDVNPGLMSQHVV